MRSTRIHNSPVTFERLYKLLIERVLRLLPNADSRDGGSTALTPLRIQESVRDAFVNALVLDRGEYNERLDYFEIRFEAALRRLRMTAQEQTWREENRRSPLQANADNPDLDIEVERAAGSLVTIDWTKKDGGDYRTSLDAAIDILPIEQIRIIEMQRLGIPISSETDPNAVTIAKTLGKAEKTIRTYRDKAYKTIRAHRERDDHDDR